MLKRSSLFSFMLSDEEKKGFMTSTPRHHQRRRMFPVGSAPVGVSAAVDDGVARLLRRRRIRRRSCSGKVGTGLTGSTPGTGSPRPRWRSASGPFLLSPLHPVKPRRQLDGVQSFGIVRRLGRDVSNDGGLAAMLLNGFSSSLTLLINKLECLSLASLTFEGSLRLGPTQVEHLMMPKLVSFFNYFVWYLEVAKSINTRD